MNAQPLTKATQDDTEFYFTEEPRDPLRIDPQSTLSPDKSNAFLTVQPVRSSPEARISLIRLALLQLILPVNT